MNVLIDNLPGDVTEAEVMAALKPRGVPFKNISLYKDGNPDLCTAIISMDTSHAGGKALVKMINGKPWKNRRIVSYLLVHFTGEGLNG